MTHFLRRDVETRVLSAPQLAYNWHECIEIATGENLNMHRHVFTTIKSHGSV
jgi:hypothetical protein